MPAIEESPFIKSMKVLVCEPLERRGAPFHIPAPLTAIIATSYRGGKERAIRALLDGEEYDLAYTINAAADLVQAWADEYGCTAHLAVHVETIGCARRNPNHQQ